MYQNGINMESLSYEECKRFMPMMTEAKCVRVYDGDTFHLGVVLTPPYGATRFCVRLLGVDTPELRSRYSAEKSLAREARDIVKKMILNKIVGVKVSQYDKYGRLLVRITTPSGEDLSQHLINEKVAVYYDGGRKKKVSWENLLKEHTEMRSSRVTQDGVA
uniref:TNase-like domain-containing protein n=1 Tax=viral metagenome TaxID=1070528 RepID=A0A6C0IXM8_9ZZZZ